MMDLDDSELLGRTSRDPEAFGAFYRRHERPVLAYFRRRVDQPELAADLAAETFAAALIAASTFRAGPAPASAWLFGIARHKLLDSLARGRVDDRARRTLGMEPLELADDALAEIETLESDLAVRRVLDNLPPDQAQAIQARVIDERPYREIADELASSPSVIRKRVSRGLATLRNTTSTEGTP